MWWSSILATVFAVPAVPSSKVSVFPTAVFVFSQCAGVRMVFVCPYYMCTNRISQSLAPGKPIS